MSRAPIDLQKRDRRWVKEGRGQGHGEHYKRWLNVQDLTKSNPGQRRLQGTLTRPQGRVVKRAYHLASYLEASVFDFFDNLDVTDWGIEVLDILEQFPLLSKDEAIEPAGDTIAIARELGVRHIPANYPESPTVMTTDLVIKARVRNSPKPVVLALEVKPTAALEDKKNRLRTLEKLEVEMVYWERHTFDNLPVQWFLVTEKQTPNDLITTLHQIGTFKDFDGSQLPSSADLALICRICRESVDLELSLSRLARQIDQRLRLRQGQSINAIYHLIAQRRLEVDLFRLLLPEKPLALQIEFSEMTHAIT